VSLKELVKDCCPPILLRFYGVLRNKRIKYKGSYISWAEAEKYASGYESDAIFQRVRTSSLKVKHREALFERDSVCFYKKDYRWPALACLLAVATERGGQLNVLDFGGALGSFYFQHKSFFARVVKKLRWSVIEQAHFVECGRNEFESNELKFYSDIKTCIQNESVDIVFISSVLQYIDNPRDILNQLSNINADYILIDRTPFIESDKDALSIQVVPEAIYKASYPAWFFSNTSFIKLISEIGYQVIEEFVCDDDVGIGQFKGFFLERVYAKST
jgi:putative methyltransferase (TIGR04325 family)